MILLSAAFDDRIHSFFSLGDYDTSMPLKKSTSLHVHNPQDLLIIGHYEIP